MDTLSEYLRNKYNDTWTSFFKTPVRNNPNLSEFRPSSLLGSSTYTPSHIADAAVEKVATLDAPAIIEFDYKPSPRKPTQASSPSP